MGFSNTPTFCHASSYLIITCQFDRLCCSEDEGESKTGLINLLSDVRSRPSTAAPTATGIVFQLGWAADTALLPAFSPRNLKTRSFHCLSIMDINGGRWCIIIRPARRRHRKDRSRLEGLHHAALPTWRATPGFWWDCRKNCSPTFLRGLHRRTYPT